MLRWVAVLLGALVLAPGAVRGQAKAGPGVGGVGGPLDKAQLVRLLAERKVSRAAIARMVRRSCLSFRPTARDSVDFQLAGADRVVFAALAACARRRPTPAAGAAGAAGGAVRAGGTGGAAGAGALRVLAAPGVTAEAGTVATITVRLLRGSAPQPGMVLVLVGSARIPGGLVRDARAITDARGAATFRVPVGTVAGTYPLAVTRPGGESPLPGGKLEVVTEAGRALHATVVPTVVELRHGPHQRIPLTLFVMDVYGNPVPGEALELRPVTAELTGPLAVPATDAQGRVAFSLQSAVVRREGEVGVFARGGSIGSFMLRVTPVVLSQYLTRFTEGTSQRGVAGSLLAQPLVFQVRDTSGAAIPDQTVTFTATGGTVQPAAAPSDSSGVVRVRVALGERAGPVVVTATAGAITQRATLYAADATGPVARVQVVAGDSQGVVTLRPRRRGAGLVSIRGSGLTAQVAVETTASGVVESLVVGARGSWTGFSYGFSQLPYIHGRAGVRGELFAGRAVTPQLKLALVAGFGALNADSASKDVSVSLTQGYLRGEYVVLRDATVRPVVSLGGGLFHIVSNDARKMVDHSSLFWFVGTGFDITLGGDATGEVRLESQQLNEMTSSIVNGHIGSLTVVEAGVRLSP
jgi:hypothetical protein